MSPLLVGLLISLKTILDAVTDSIMAQINDNARTLWGRRIPCILVGGVSRLLLVLLRFLCLPRCDEVRTNKLYQ